MGGSEPWTQELPPESFAAGPFGSVVLVGSDDGTQSRLSTVDVLDGCASTVATSSDVIRRATISPDRTTLVESRVDRRTRGDLGTWRHSLDDPHGLARILPPIDDDDRFGRTWSTDFSWAEDGSLAVQACGEASCRTRVLDAAWHLTATVAEPDLGETIGLASGRLVSYLACRGLPCPIVVTDLPTGVRMTLVDGAGAAVVTSTRSGPRLVMTRDVERGQAIASLKLDGTNVTDLGPLPDGFDLQTAPSRAQAGVAVPAGWAVLAPDGRMPVVQTDPAPTLLDVLDGRSAALGEDLP